MAEKLDFPVGTQLCLDDVLMVGTADYTTIGRPVVENAKVYVTVEENSQTEKVWIFKKRRRKDSQRHRGHRQWVTILKVDRIEHQVQAEQVQKDAQVMEIKPEAYLL